MKPFYQEGLVTIYCGETLNILAGMSAGEVAAVIVDPPYSSGGMFRSDRQAAPDVKYRGWSQNPDGSRRSPTSMPGSFMGDSRDQHGFYRWASLWLSELWRIAMPTAQVFVFTDWRQLPVISDAVQAGGWTWRGLLVWDKGVGRPMRGRFRNHLEYLVWGSHGAMPEAENIYPSTLLRHAPPGSDRLHVTEKPETLIRELLSVAPAGTVLDPFMGVGTTLRAAKDLGREAVGIEIEERYCEAAVRRCAQEVLATA